MAQPPTPPPSLADIAARATIAVVPLSSLSAGLSVLYEGMRDRHQARVDQVSVAAIGQVDPQEVGRRLVERPELDAVLVAALQAGGVSALEAKRRLLGKVVNRAVLDDALVDHATLIVGVLSQIDAPHVRCLEAVRRAEQEAERAGEVESRAPGAERATVARIYEAGRSHPDPVLSVLASLGLLEANGVGAGSFTVKGLTPFGLSLLSDLHQT